MAEYIYFHKNQNKKNPASKKNNTVASIGDESKEEKKTKNHKVKISKK